MVNPTLARSALVISVIHAIGFAALQPSIPYALFLAAGCGTSVWNHATTSEIAKWADRGVMGIGTVLTMIIAPTPLEQALMLLTVAAYTAAKKCGSNHAHILSHGLITFINLRIMAAT